MTLEDDAAKGQTLAIVPGEDLSRYSIGELEERVQCLADEIARCKSAIEAKRATHNDAEAVFGRST